MVVHGRAFAPWAIIYCWSINWTHKHIHRPPLLIPPRNTLTRPTLNPDNPAIPKPNGWTPFIPINTHIFWSIPSHTAAKLLLTQKSEEVGGWMDGWRSDDKGLKCNTINEMQDHLIDILLWYNVTWSLDLWMNHIGLGQTFDWFRICGKWLGTFLDNQALLMGIQWLDT